MRPTICLSMIVKNEAQALSNSLELIKPYIDYWIISDTGSTDNTIDVINATMKGIPGEVHRNSWVDFSTNRNIALRLAKNKSDYILISDADDALIVEDSSFKDKLYADAYKIKIKHGGIEYYRPQLIKSSIHCEYVGVLHEYLDFKQHNHQEILDGVYFGYNAFSGARSSNVNKFLNDIEVLKKGLKKEPNNSRYVFYLAQSYKDAGNYEKSIEFYKKRSLMGGWQEEVFISLLNVGRLSELLNKPDVEVEIPYLQAYYACPHRSESLYQLAKYFRVKNNFNKGYCYAKEALKISKPKESLFLEECGYDYGALDELAICAYYVGMKEEGKLACEKLLSMNIPEFEKSRIINNYKFYT